VIRARPLLLALAAGLVLADASVVTLALPDLLVELHTTVEGVAAVIGVYTLVLVVALLPAEQLARRVGPAPVATGGFIVFAAASMACGAADSLGPLLAGRCVQAAGGAAALIATFSLLVGPGEDHRAERRLWLGAAVLSTALGPALGGALTEAFSWEAIFWTQAPIAAAAAVVAWGARPHPAPARSETAPPFTVRASLALALVSAALTAVLFLLVLLLVAGWSVSPLSAAATVFVIPLGALVASRAGGDPQLRAAAGCLLVGAGTIALGFLPDAHLGWVLIPGALAGAGMGLALPALGGDLLPERDARDAARLLTIRHAGIAVALLVLAPVVSSRLDDATFRAQERGVALVLDAKLPPEDKLDLAPALLSGVDDRDPRDGLRRATDERRSQFEGDDLVVFDRLAERADDTLVTAVGEAFDIAFVITGTLALLGAACLVPRRLTPAAIGAAVAAAAVLGGYVIAQDQLAPEPVTIADPCGDRDLPGTGGITGFLQDRALEALDTSACRLGSSREELVLALADDAARERFKERHGTDPRDVGSLLEGLLGG
jgi:predicted MFS family arabinose efflux permease